MSQVFTRGGNSSEVAVDVEELTHESVSVAVVRIVSAYVGTEIDEMPPIEAAVAPDALDDLTEQAMTDPEVTQTEVRFHYHGVWITVTSTGELRLRFPPGDS